MSGYDAAMMLSALVTQQGPVQQSPKDNYYIWPTPGSH